MVTLYTSPSCTSCRKARAWLKEHGIPFTERNIFSEPLSMDEVKTFLRMTENGTEDIISKRSKAYQSLNINLDEMSMTELYDLIRKNPGLLRRPIIMDDKRLQIDITKMRFVGSCHVKSEHWSWLKHVEKQT